MTKTRIQNRIQMYDKNAYKCMTKTRIQMYEKKHAHKCMTKIRIHLYEKTGIPMYEKKQAYKCMKKTQMYEKNMHTNTHTNV